jgi:hypothetical protein
VAAILRTLFAWPGGIVVGNLIASVMWAAPALTHLHIKMNRHHREQGARISELE